MPAKDLTLDQLADAARLRTLFSSWQQQRKLQKEASSQEAAAALLGFGQSALNQYLNGKIPLNATALGKFSELLKCEPAEISPALAEDELKKLEKHLHGRSRETRFRPLFWVTEIAKFIEKLDPISRAMATGMIRHLLDNPQSHEEVKLKLEGILESRKRIALESTDDTGRTGKERIAIGHFKGFLFLNPSVLHDPEAVEELIARAIENNPRFNHSFLTSLVEGEKERFKKEMLARRILKGIEAGGSFVDSKEVSDPKEISTEEWVEKLVNLTTSRKPSINSEDIRQAVEILSKNWIYRSQAPEKINQDLGHSS